MIAHEYANTIQKMLDMDADPNDTREGVFSQEEREALEFAVVSLSLERV